METRRQEKQTTDVFRVLQEAVQTDYCGRLSILGNYHRVFPASHRWGVQGRSPISYVQVVLVQSLIFGLIIELIISYVLLRLFDKIPTKNPILKSEIVSLVAL
jgi:hypothetical protein